MKKIEKLYVPKTRLARQPALDVPQQKLTQSNLTLVNHRREQATRFIQGRVL